MNNTIKATFRESYKRIAVYKPNRYKKKTHILLSTKKKWGIPNYVLAHTGKVISGSVFTEKQGSGSYWL